MDDLKVLLRAVLNTVDSLVADAFGSQPVHKPQAVITHGEDGSVQTHFEMKPDYADMLFSLRQDLSTLPEVVALNEYVRNNHGLASNIRVDAAGVPLPNDAEHFLNFTLWPFMTRYFRDISRVGEGVEGVIFDGLFGDLQRYVEEPQVAYIYEAPLVGLKADMDRINFSDDVWARRRTDEDIKMVSKPYSYGDPELNEVTFSTHFLVSRVFVAKHAPLNSEDAAKISSEVLSAFRLYRSAAIRLGASRYYPELRVGPMQGVMTTPAPFGLGGDYRLEESDVQNIKVLFERCGSNNDPRWRLALRRLNLTFERKLPEDRLIDSWVGLETLLLPDGKDGELRFKGSMRLAQFLGEDSAQKLELRKDTRTSYDRRSQVVHGNTPLNEDLPEVANKTVELLRQVLVRWLDDTYPHDIKSIDDSFLS